MLQCQVLQQKIVVVHAYSVELFDISITWYQPKTNV